MEKGNKIKILIAIAYAVIVSLFLWLFFSKFSLSDFTSYEFIKNNRDYFYELKKLNLLLLATLFIIFTIVWVFAAGFGSPIAIFSGFIFGKWLGLFLLTFGMSVGATGLYLIANYFFKDLIKMKFLSRFQKLDSKFKKSEFLYLLIYRFVGGIPFAISNVLPCIFNVKTQNFFWATLIGIVPSIFIICSLGEGVEKIIDRNIEAPSFSDLITTPQIYVPLIIFVLLVMLTIFLRKLFYDK